jgi:hypothetical protein
MDNKQVQCKSNRWGNEMVFKLNFRRIPSQNYYIACEIAKRAYKHVILDNECPDDDESENHEVTFTDEQMMDMRLMLNVIGNSGLTEGPIGFNLYGVDIKYFIKNITHFCGWQMKLKPKKVEAATEIIDHMVANSGKWGAKYRDSSQLISHLTGKYGYQLENFYRYGVNSYSDWTKRKLSHLTDEDEYHNAWLEQNTYFKSEKEKILRQLIIEKKMPSKWKSEEDLYRLVVATFPDAKFHHSPRWLWPQHYDIYIPTIQTAIEYQGVQHYSPVDFFGGAEKFKHRLELDEKKRLLTLSNGIKMIEWKYDEPISKILLKKRLN